ncbi:NAD(P)-binding protein [Leucogyrophana mollusca]|uniref:NAD(P)-binding protein n=1 Tax=Leucogyrophana mollusca TaxID=85980 RepID=A0ACB8BVJ5_9AGAM|nr:NAD(P)-binding protein [Leucogyrophana mollusca]
MASTQVWFITGASSGFGLSMVEVALASGDIVVATARKPEALAHLSAHHTTNELLVIQLDVTKHEQVAAAFAQAKNAFGRVDIVYNNAGQAVLGEIECVPDDLARALFDINFWGAVNVSREAVRFFREENPSGRGGTLLQTSSVLAIRGIACLSYYSAGKWALEGFSESLSQELDPKWNIKIVVLQAGWHRTKINSRATRLPGHPAYLEPTSAVMQTRDVICGMDESQVTQDVDKASRAIFEFLRSADSEGVLVRLPLGKDSVAATKEKIILLSETVGKCEKWSKDLTIDKSE